MQELKDYFLSYGMTEREADILADHCQDQEQEKERAIEFADEILANYEAKL